MSGVRVLLIRHTETEASARLRCVGRTDVMLSSAGKSAVAERAQRVAEFAPERLISSPLRRCRELAEAAAKLLGYDLELDARWQEFDFGDWEGKSWVELGLNAEARAWMNHYWEQAPPGGEAPQAMLQRVREVLEELARGSEKRVAVVTHGGVIRVALCLRDGKEMRAAFDYEVGFGEAVELTLPFAPAMRQEG